jgi:hypothetical protein
MDRRQWAISVHGPAELIAASFAFWWGFWITSPWWVVFGTSRTYRVMELVAPDYVWGGALMLAGLVLACSSLQDVTVAKLPALLFLVAYFVFVSIVFGAANIGSTAPITYLHVAATYAWLWFTARRRVYG